MPQLDILSYFSQFVFLLFSFLITYYFIITYVIPSTITAAKLRAKFNTHQENSKNTLGISKQSISDKDYLDRLTSEALAQLAYKSSTSATVDTFFDLNKASHSNIKSALLFHYSYILARKKRLVDIELTVV